MIVWNAVVSVCPECGDDCEGEICPRCYWLSRSPLIKEMEAEAEGEEQK